MMVLELLTNQAFGRTSSYVGSWQKDPNLFSLLQENNFKRCVRSVWGISDRQIELALNFIHSFLMSDRRLRWNSGKAADHCFLEDGSQIGEGPYQKWGIFCRHDGEESHESNVNRNRDDSKRLVNIVQSQVQPQMDSFTNIADLTTARLTAYTQGLLMTPSKAKDVHRELII
nr:uncharacterized protein LOC122274081 [Parasteatoda tepidariorum]